MDVKLIRGDFEMEEIEYQSNGQPVAVDFEDLKEKLGYKT